MKRKTVFLLCLILLTVIGLSGCRRHGATIDRMMEHLAQKYPDDTFIFDYDNTALLSSGVRIVAHSERFPDKEIEVVCYNYGETERYYDTYLGIKYEDQTREYFTNLFTTAFEANCSVLYSRNTFCDIRQPDKDVSLEKYVADASSHIELEVHMEYCPVDWRETLNKVKGLLADYNIDCMVFFTDDPNIGTEKQTSDWIYRPEMYIYFNNNDHSTCWSVKDAHIDSKEKISKLLQQGFHADIFVSVQYESYDENHFVAVVKYNSDNKEGTLETVKSLFADMAGSGTIYFVDDPSLILDESTAKQIIDEKKYVSELYFFKSSPETYNKIEWKE